MNKVLEFEDVRLTYKASSKGAYPVDALKGVNLSLSQGAVAGLVGVNGAGKTTLLELIVGSLQPTAGTIQWFGKTTLSRSMRHRIGFCPAVPGIPPYLSVREALFLYAGLRKLSRSEATNRVAAMLDRLGIERLSEQRISALSTGNLVRVGLAQAMIGGPDLLLLDESFATLDPRAQADLRGTLKELSAGGTSILVSSHQLDQVEKVSDEVYILDGGCIIKHLSRDEFRGRYVAILDISSLSRQTRDLALEAFSGARESGNDLMVPLPKDGSDHEIRQKLTGPLARARVSRIEEESLESILLGRGR